jgi:hypothetical protein
VGESGEGSFVQVPVCFESTYPTTRQSDGNWALAHDEMEATGPLFQMR